MYELKIYRGTICYDNEKDAKLEEELTCSSKIEMRILTRALKNLKNLHFNGLLLTKVYNV